MGIDVCGATDDGIDHLQAAQPGEAEGKQSVQTSQSLAVQRSSFLEVRIRQVGEPEPRHPGKVSGQDGKRQVRDVLRFGPGGHHGLPRGFRGRRPHNLHRRFVRRHEPVLQKSCDPLRNHLHVSRCH